MSLVTAAIGTAKKVKRSLNGVLSARTPVYLSPVRRIERVRTSERVCAMTFDDGPMNLPASPDHFDGKPLTLVLLETLERHGAKGTFDIVGDTSSNYPDRAGKHGSATWGGIAFDHYPDFEKDAFGGAEHCDALVRRILDGGHQITNHTYSHRLFGRKNVVYGRRIHLNSLEEVVADIERLNRLMQERYGYRPTMMRPPHYVDGITGGFSSYDACALTGCQYLAASFDGAGWLPCQTYEQEVEATWKPIEAALNADPDALCGQIIFQKDGYNMARRTPIADGLERALTILDAQGYRVVTVEELLRRSPFADIGVGDPCFEAACALDAQGYTVVFRNNRVNPAQNLTRGALAMLLFGVPGAKTRVALLQGRQASRAADVPAAHPYSGAIQLALERGVLSAPSGSFRPDAPADSGCFDELCRAVYGSETAVAGALTHGEAILALASLEARTPGRVRELLQATV